ncbi:MAG: hypothetical protein WA192_07825 [Candidatus Acidiferrales bacterium]
MNDLLTKPIAPHSSASSAKADPAEETQYKAFSKLKADNPDKRIQVGGSFVQKYPDGPFSEAVYSQLSISEYQKQDFDKMDGYADKALALDPDDVTVLVFTGWVLPHSSNVSPAQLDKAEKYEKHVLELLPTLTKPANMTDKEFATAKSEYESQAHSGLGLVNYQRQNFAGTVTEMNKATSSGSDSDPADYYVLGVSLENLQQYSDASEAFKQCAASPNVQQELCKQKAVAATKEAAAKPAPSEVATTHHLPG